MLNRQWYAVVISLLLALSVSACTAGAGIIVPDREVPISVNDALEAQSLAINGMLVGNVEWTEVQFSSLLTELLKANSGENNPVDSITAWFEPGEIYLTAQLKSGVLPPALGDTVAIAGTLVIEENHLVLDIEQASAGQYVLSGTALAPINAQINGVLASQPIGVPIEVTLESGRLSIGLAQ